MEKSDSVKPTSQSRIAFFERKYHPNQVPLHNHLHSLPQIENCLLSLTDPKVRTPQIEKFFIVKLIRLFT